MHVWVRRPGTYAGKARDFGEVFDLAPAPRNEQLLRLGYLQEHTGEQVACGECGAKFINGAERTRHGQKRHVSRERRVRDLDDLSHEELRHLNRRDGEVFELRDQLTVGDLDLEHVEREERVIEERAPLFLENTAASRK